MSDEETTPKTPAELVAREARRIREKQRIPYTELSDRLTALGHPIPVLGLRRIERGERRVDIEELTALALALGVPPVALAFPLDDPSELVQMASDWTAPIWKAVAWFDGEPVADSYASTSDGGPWDLAETSASWWRATRPHAAAREHQQFMELWAEARQPPVDERVVQWVEAQWRKRRQVIARFTEVGWLPKLPPGLEHIDRPMEGTGGKED